MSRGLFAGLGTYYDVPCDGVTLQFQLSKSLLPIVDLVKHLWMHCFEIYSTDRGENVNFFLHHSDYCKVTLSQIERRVTPKLISLVNRGTTVQFLTLPLGERQVEVMQFTSQAKNVDHHCGLLNPVAHRWRYLRSAADLSSHVTTYHIPAELTLDASELRQLNIRLIDGKESDRVALLEERNSLHFVKIGPHTVQRRVYDKVQNHESMKGIHLLHHFTDREGMYVIYYLLSKDCQVKPTGKLLNKFRREIIRIETANQVATGLMGSFFTGDEREAKTVPLNLYDDNIGDGAYGIVYQVGQLAYKRAEGLDGERKVIVELWNRIGSCLEKGALPSVVGLIAPPRFCIKDVTIDEDSYRPWVLGMKHYETDLCHSLRANLELKSGWAIQLLWGLYWVMRCELIHLDLKLANVVREKGDAVHIDFADASFLPKPSSAEEAKTLFGALQKRDFAMTAECSNPIFYNSLVEAVKRVVDDPENYEAHIESFSHALIAAQMFSMGVVLFQLFAKKYPFSMTECANNKQVPSPFKGRQTLKLEDVTDLQDQERALKETGIDEELQKLILGCIAIEPEHRPNKESLLQFLKTNDPDRFKQLFP